MAFWYSAVQTDGSQCQFLLTRREDRTHGDGYGDATPFYSEVKLPLKLSANICHILNKPNIEGLED